MHAQYLYLQKHLRDFSVIYAKSVLKHLIQTSPGHAHFFKLCMGK